MTRFNISLAIKRCRDNKLVKRHSCHHIETSQLTCSANQLTGFYMMVTLVFNELIMILNFVFKSRLIIAKCCQYCSSKC